MLNAVSEFDEQQVVITAQSTSFIRSLRCHVFGCSHYYNAN